MKRSGIVLVIMFLLPASALAAYLATGVLGQPSLTVNCDNYATTASGLVAPLDVDVDTVQHHMYVADYGNYRVLVFDLDASNNLVDRTADHVLGQANFTTCVAQPISASAISTPRSLVHDDTNQLLYVSDTGNNRVLVFDTSTITNGEAAIHVLGQSSMTGTVDGCAARTRFTICGANTLELDTAGQRLFVAENSSRVSVWDVASATIYDGEYALSALGQADFTSIGTGFTQSTFFNTHGLAYDPATAYLFVSDDINGRIMVFDAASVSLGENALYVLGAGSNFTTDEGSAKYLSSRGLGRTLGVAVDSAGHRLFAGDFDYGLVKVWDFDDFPLANAATESYVLGAPDFSSYSSALNNPSAAHLYSIHGVQYEPDTGKLYVANIYNSIRIFDVSTITNGEDAVDNVGQTTPGGDPIYTKSGHNNGPNAQGVRYTRGVALDTVNHRLFVGDVHGNRIVVHQLDANNDIIDDTADYVLGQTDFLSNTATTSQDQFYGTYMYDVEFDSDHNRLYAVFYETPRVLMWDLSGGITNGMNTTAVLGQSDFTSATAAVTQAGLYAPAGIAYDSVSDYLYVAEYSAHRVMVYDTSGAVTTGMNAKAVLGQSSWTTSSYGTTTTTLRYPYDACLDENGRRLFVADYDNDRVLAYDITTVASGQAAIDVLGQSDFVTRGGATTQAGLSGPTSCAYDSAHGRLYVNDYHNYRIMVYDVATLTDGEPAVGVIGQNDYTTATAATAVTAGQFNTLGFFLEFDSTNHRLWYADTYNSRILQYEFVDLPSATLSTATQNTAYSQSLGERYTQGTKAFTLVSGALPSGISLGSLSGTPTHSGTYNFTVRLTDSNGDVGSWWDERSYSLTVDAEVSAGGRYNPPPFIAPSTPTPSPSPTPTLSPSPSLTPVPSASPTLSPTPSPIPSPTPSPLPSVSESPVPSPTISFTPIPTSTPLPSDLVFVPLSPDDFPSVPTEEQETGEPSVIQLLSGVPGIIGRVITDTVVPVVAPVLTAVIVVPVALSGFSAAAVSGSPAGFMFSELRHLLEIIGIKRRRRVWGVVYDSTTKRPIPYAQVDLRDQSNRILETRYADRFGRYGFLTAPSSLHQKAVQVALNPRSPQYRFPSQIVTTDPDFIVYDHVYKGGLLTITKDVLVNYNIPLDARARATKTPSLTGSFLSRSLTTLLNAGFWIGVVTTPLNVLLFPSALSISVFVFFVLANGFRISLDLYRPYGLVYDATTHKPLSYALVTLTKPNGDRASFAVSDEQGRYFLIADPGTYTLSIFTPAQTQPPRSQQLPLTTKKGWIREKVQV